MFFRETALDEKEGLEYGSVGMTMPVPLFRNNDVRNREGIRYGKQTPAGHTHNDNSLALENNRRLFVLVA